MGALLRMIRESIRAVPAMRYAMAVVGLMAAAAIAKTLLSSQGPVAAVVVIAILVAMVLLVVFARLAATNNPAVASAAVFMLWTVMVAFALSIALLFSAVIFGAPVTIADWIGGSYEKDWQVRVFNIDFSSELYLNGRFLNKANYGDNELIDIGPHVKKGTNKLELVVTNQVGAAGGYPGVTYGLQVLHSGEIITEAKCGQQSIAYCPDVKLNQLPFHAVLTFNGK